MAPSGQRTPLGAILLGGVGVAGQDFFPITRRKKHRKPAIKAARCQHESIVPKQAKADNHTGEGGDERKRAPARRGRNKWPKHPKPGPAPELGQIEIRCDTEPFDHHPPSQRVNHRPALVIGQRGEAVAEPRPQQTLPSKVGPAGESDPYERLRAATGEPAHATIPFIFNGHSRRDIASRQSTSAVRSPG